MTQTAQATPLLRTVLLGAGLVIIAGGLHAAASIVNLILISMLLATTVYPLQYLLTQRGMNRGVALLVTLLLVLFTGAGLVTVLAASLTRMAEELPKYAPAFSGIVDRVTQSLTARGIDLSQALKPDPGRILGLAQGLVQGALGALGQSFFVLILVALFMLEMPLRRTGDAAPGSLNARMDDVALSVRRFVGLNGLLGAGAAILDLVVMLAVGTDFPAVWTVVCFLFAFVPFGFLISLIPPLLLTLLEHGPTRAIVLFTLFVVINTIFDNVVKPKVMGAGLGLSPLAIVLSLMFWAFVLGPIGAILAVPLTIVVVKTLPILVGEPVGQGG